MATTMSAPCQVVRPPSPGWSPQRPEVGAVECPPDEVGDRDGHHPHRDSPYVPADEADRPDEAECEREPAEDERPGPLRLEAE